MEPRSGKASRDPVKPETLSLLFVLGSIFTTLSGDCAC